MRDEKAFARLMRLKVSGGGAFCCASSSEIHHMDGYEGARA